MCCETKWQNRMFLFFIFYKTGFAFLIIGFCRYIGFGVMLQWPLLFYQIDKACNKFILTILQIFIYNIKFAKRFHYFLRICFLLFLIHVWGGTDTLGSLHWSLCIYFCLLIFPSRFIDWHIKCSSLWQWCYRCHLTIDNVRWSLLWILINGQPHILIITFIFIILLAFLKCSGNNTKRELQTSIMCQSSV